VDRGFDPRTCRRFQVHVAFDPRSQAPRAEFGEPIVERTAGRTELRVARIAERKHGKLQRIEPRRAPPVQEVEQRPDVIRRVAVAVGTDDEQQHALVRKLLG